jgi:hypothetical protein
MHPPGVGAATWTGNPFVGGVAVDAYHVRVRDHPADTNPGQVRKHIFDLHCGHRRHDLPNAASCRAAAPTPEAPVEGHVNRIRMLKRQAYGRANFDLLRKRILLA